MRRVALLATAASTLAVTLVGCAHSVSGAPVLNRAEPFTVFAMTGQARPMAEAARAPAWTGAAYTLGAIGAAR